MYTPASIQEFLIKEFGLSEIEAKIYIGLLEKGPSSVLDISRYTGIKRATVHLNVENLVQMGLASQSRSGRGARRIIIPEAPDKLKALLEQKKWILQQAETNLPKVLESITTLIPRTQANSDITVRYYEGKSNVFDVYRSTFEADEVYSFADLEKYYTLFPETKELWVEAFHKNEKRNVWDILVDSPIARSEMRNGIDRYKAKLLPKKDTISEFNFTDYIIFDNKLIIVDLNPKAPQATVIQSKDVAFSMKALHRVMWSLLS